MAINLQSRAKVQLNKAMYQQQCGNMFPIRVVTNCHPDQQFRSRGIFLYDLDPVPFDSRVDVALYLCFNCWQFGHTHQQCQQPRTRIFCDNCGRINVTVDRCPRCARAFARFWLAQKHVRDNAGVNIFKYWTRQAKPSKPCTIAKCSHPSTEKETTPILTEPEQNQAKGNQRDPSTYPWRETGTSQGGVFKDINPIPFDPKVDVPYGVCFNCWQYDHTRANCTAPYLKDHCTNCGRIGVRLYDCPRCSDAYERHWQRQKEISKGEVSQAEEKEDRDGEVHDASLQTIEEQITEDSDENYDDVIVDENEKSCEVTGTFLESFLLLMDSIKFLPAEEQSIVAQKFVTKRCPTVTRKET